jgi:hypothetical protein
MPIPIIFSPSFPTWGSHNHFVGVRYTTRGPTKSVVLVHFRTFRPIAAAHPTCVFPSLADNTHIIGLTSNVVLTFLRLQKELSTLGFSM